MESRTPPGAEAETEYVKASAPTTARRARGRGPLLPAAELLATAEQILPEVDRRLRAEYGDVKRDEVPLGNKRNPLEELIYIQLSVRTRESTYQSTYLALRRLVGGAWERLLSLPDASPLRVMEGGGMARLKLARLRGQLAAIRHRFGRVSLAPLREMDDSEAEAFLRELPGVGPKVARCVLLYSLDREVFPVDSNCRRVLDRIGLLPSGVDIKAAHDFLQSLVPLTIRRSLHVNLVHHGRRICVVGTPRCDRCPLVDLCKVGRRRFTDSPSA